MGITSNERQRPPLNAIESGNEWLTQEQCLQIHRLMVRGRALEERMIKMVKSGEGYFWIGGPGEEAFNVCLGLQVRKGFGPLYDYVHLHYRGSGVMLAMGMDPADAIRQMASSRTDPFSLGRNFVGHFAKREWNVVPVTSAIEIHFSMAPGTALMQKRAGGEGITIVAGGESGTAEGDFASCMIWSTRPGNEVPVLMLVMNNGWGISTPAESQHADEHYVDRGRAFGIPGEIVDGNDPIKSFRAIERGMTYCRTNRRPYLIEARVSRLYGHSSASGAIRVEGEPDCIPLFERKLVREGLLNREQIRQIHQEAEREVETALQQVLREPRPSADDVLKHTYAPSPVDRVYPQDFTGLPQ